jgi:hypothetical protein
MEQGTQFLECDFELANEGREGDGQDTSEAVSNDGGVVSVAENGVVALQGLSEFQSKNWQKKKKKNSWNGRNGKKMSLTIFAAA